MNHASRGYGEPAAVRGAGLPEILRYVRLRAGAVRLVAAPDAAVRRAQVAKPLTGGRGHVFVLPVVACESSGAGEQ